MDPLSSVCLAAILVLSLPLPLLASRAISSNRLLSRSMLLWVSVHVGMCAAMGLLLIVSPIQPIVAVGVAAVALLTCGLPMWRRMSHPRTLTNQ